jgi:hypothetical protein
MLALRTSPSSQFTHRELYRGRADQPDDSAAAENEIAKFGLPFLTERSVAPVNGAFIAASSKVRDRGIRNFRVVARTADTNAECRRVRRLGYAAARSRGPTAPAAPPALLYRAPSPASRCCRRRTDRARLCRAARRRSPSRCAARAVSSSTLTRRRCSRGCERLCALARRAANSP